LTKNFDIKERALKKGVCLWEVAEIIGIADTSMSRKLRKELPQAEKDRIFKIIDDIAAEKAAKNNAVQGATNTPNG
jgi:hypothetical protein